MKNYSRILSKSSFMHYQECPIWHWLEKVRPELLPPTDPGLQRIFDQGNLVDDLARKLFPGGIAVQDYNVRGFENTKKAISKGAKILYQPTAAAEGLSSRADILVKGRGGKWDLYEVKSATSVSAEYITDVAFQRTCFERAGIPIGKTFLVHINNKYVRKGELDAEKLFIKEDITDKVLKMMPEVALLIPEVMKPSWPKNLDAVHLEACPNLGKCEYVGYWFNTLKPKARESLLQKLDTKTVAKMLEKDIVESEGLSDKFLASVAYRSPEERWPKKIEKENIREVLATLKYPLYFFDYETYWPAIPPFDGYRPYQQIPFQFAVYVLDDIDATPRTYDFLMDKFTEPSVPLIAALREAIGPEGTVIAWNATFEKTRNKELADRYPKDAKFLLGINDRTYDLMQIFKKNNYVHPDFGGSASLKEVMPTLVPDLSYDSLNIQEGGTASASWPVLCDPKLPEEERKQLHKDMIDYCRLDVYGMVKILAHLRKVSR